MNVIEFIASLDLEDQDRETFQLTEDQMEQAFKYLQKVGTILKKYQDKHKLSPKYFGETYFQSDDIMIEGSQEVFPEIMELLLKEID